MIHLENNFEPSYKTITGKSKIVRELKKEAKDADKIYLATDPDREGEAISWHLAEILDLDVNDVERVVFNEITKSAVQDAFTKPRKIDMDLVESQESRRILDRIIGFRLSKLLQSKIGSKSAGRVQSVALKLIVDREDEINAFIPEEYWELVAKHILSEEQSVEFKLNKFKGKKAKIESSEQMDEVLANLDDAKYFIEGIEKKKTSRMAKLPHTTSRLQQEAANRLGFGARKTMSVAQKLYEGMKIGAETVGLITYMRTDSTRLSDDFVSSTFNFVEASYGKEYQGVKRKEKKSETTQDAHEAIRPTDVYRTPASVAKYLTADELKLYELIWVRAVSSLMAKATFNNVKIVMSNNDCEFQANGQTILFDGYLIIASQFEQVTEQLLPDYTEKHYIEPVTLAPSQHFTQPPARYTEATLVKKLEESGIGRPSTYATILDTIQKRGYVLLDQKRFTPTEQGVLTNTNLQEHFADIMNVDYTAQIESELDDIAQGDLDELTFLTNFYSKFEPALDKANENMVKIPPKETGEVCPECGSPLVVHRSRYSEFERCSNNQTCKYIKPSKEQAQNTETNITCPKCKDGKIVQKRTRRGKIFWGCNKYPSCDFATWYEPIDEICPKCEESILVQKGKKVACATCDYERVPATNDEPKEETKK